MLGITGIKSTYFLKAAKKKKRCLFQNIHKLAEKHHERDSWGLVRVGGGEDEMTELQPLNLTVSTSSYLHELTWGTVLCIRGATEAAQQKS